MPTIEVNTVKLFYEERGEGLPLICIPGALGNGSRDFAPQLDALSCRFRVIAPDLRGYGRSRPPNRDFASDFFRQDAEDVFALMTALGCSRFQVAGWSDGANSAVLMAAAHPREVEKLLIWGGNSYVTSEDLTRLESIRFISSWSARMRGDLEAIYAESLQFLWDSYLEGIRKRYQDRGEICIRQLPLIECPTLILHGARDPLVPDFHPRAFYSGIANSRLHIFPNAGHSIHLAQAEEFNRVAMDFL